MSSNAIQILFNDKTIQTIPLKPDGLTIGRMKENDIVIDNLGVSRFHAKIFLENGQIILEDQESENGSYVNGIRVRRTAISPQDQIIIGKHQLRILEGSESAQTNSPGVKTKEISPFTAPSQDSFSSNDPYSASSTYVVDEQTQDKILKRIAEKVKDLNEKKSEPFDSLLDKPFHIPANLILKFKEDIEQIMPWNKNSLQIGRAPECEIVLDQPQVSRKHAVLERKENAFHIQDLDSGNGTLVNGERIRKKTLNHDDVISIADYKIIFQLLQMPISSDIITQDFPNPEITEPPPIQSPAESIFPGTPNIPQGIPIEKNTSTSPSSEEKMEVIHSGLTNYETQAEFQPDTPPEVEIQNSEISGKLSLDMNFSYPPDSSEESTSANPPKVGSKHLSFEIKVDASSLPTALQKTLSEYINEDGKIPLNITLLSVPKKKN